MLFFFFFLNQKKAFSMFGKIENHQLFNQQTEWRGDYRLLVSGHWKPGKKLSDAHLWSRGFFNSPAGKDWNSLVF